MPKDISSSEDEADSPTLSTKSPEKQKESDKKSTKFECPADFVSFCHKPCSSTLTESLRNNESELWLIKAPANFNPECFSSMKVPLSGLRTMKVRVAAGGEQTRSSKQIYSVLASTHASSDLCLLTSDKQESGRAAFGPAFCGVLNICESYGDSSTNQAPQVIPATPAPSIPPGLRQRFHPFGSRTPTLTCKAKREADGQAEEDEGQTKKKKRKKEKGVKAERADEEEVKIKEEPVAETQEELMMEVSDAVEEKRKKKKKKKDREREEEGVEHSMMVNMEEITVKSEPVDTLYGDVVDGSGKKKKKKKKNKTDDD